MNIIFVSHGGLTAQSTYHILSIAEQLKELGYSCIVCVPSLEKESSKILQCVIPILEFKEAQKGKLYFENGKGPDCVHCWTPREMVREFTLYIQQRYGCPYFVHLEDNEREILNRELREITYEKLAKLSEKEQDSYIINKKIRINPHRSWEFLKGSAGCTVLIERLKEHVPQGVPCQLFWPGYDTFFRTCLSEKRPEICKRLEIPADGFIVLYSGAFHEINYNEISRMVSVLKILHWRGLPIYFIKTGSNVFPWLLSKGADDGWVKDLGFVPRKDLLDVYAVANVLIQPGNSDPFNDYRFPSKLPEALIQGVPIILPQTNLGEVLADQHEALVTCSGSMDELAEKIVWLYEHPEEARQIGKNGQEFARNNLTWEKAASVIEQFYHLCLHGTQEDLNDRGLIQHQTTTNTKVTSDPLWGRPTQQLHHPIEPDEILQKDSINTYTDGNFLLEKKLNKKKRRFKRLMVISIIEFLAIVMLTVLLLN